MDRLRELQELLKDQAGEIRHLQNFVLLIEIMEPKEDWMLDLESQGILIWIMKKMKTTIKSLLFMIIGSSLFFGMTSLDAQELESETKSQEEIDRELEKELAKIQEAYEEESLEEFVPSEPLSADVAVSFPSDIEEIVMNGNNLSKEFLYQALALIVSIILVHATYVSLIRPEAKEIIKEQQIMIEQDVNYVPERSFYVIVRDFEQEACFILMLWAFAIMTIKANASINERRLLREDLIPIRIGESINPNSATDYLRQLEGLDDLKKDLFLTRTLINGLKRFTTTKNVQDVSTTTHTMVESEAERLESELSMIRYIAWAIPSIGFIGTVRGIGAALSLAHRAVDGDISGVTQNLGVAFNSTFIALLISIVIMFMVHQLQLLQERQIFETETYCDENLITHLKGE